MCVCVVYVTLCAVSVFVCVMFVCCVVCLFVCVCVFVVVVGLCNETCGWRCYGPDADNCCHPNCAVGCTGPGPQDCMVCSSVCLSACVSLHLSVCVSLHLSRPSCPSAPLSFRLERSNPDHQASSSVKSFCLIESTGLMFNNKNGIYVTEVPEKNVKKLSAVEN